MSQSIVDALRAKEAQMRQHLAAAQAAADARRAAVPAHRRLRIVVFLTAGATSAAGLLAMVLGAPPIVLAPAGFAVAAYVALRLRG